MIFSNLFKKRFSPLVATILLIAFSVALSTVVINWKGTFVIKNDDVCSKISFDIETSNDIQFCYKPVSNNIEVNFIIKNKGGMDIEGISMLIIGSNGKKIEDLENIIIKKNSLFYVKDLEVQYDLKNYGTINRIYFIPRIEYNDISDICPKHFIEVDKISQCP